MIEQLKAAADQLHAAWDNYSSVYSSLKQYQTKRSALHTYGFPPELSSLLDTELAFVSSLPSKIAQIKVTMRRARNYNSGLATINALPSEVLTRIFYLVLDRPCRFYRPSLINRADVYKDRIGRMPIELHVAEVRDYEEKSWDYGYLCDFLHDISPRVETLEFVATGGFGPFHRAVFSGLLIKGNSNLKKLVLSSRGQHHNTFIYPASLDRLVLDDTFRDFRLDLSEPDFARGFSTINVLHARGIFPSWSSTAYHGLVDLRLLSTSQRSHIEEVQIRSILESSPGLRILHFGLAIENSAPETTHVTPVHLNDLEVVKLYSSSKSRGQQHFTSMLRLLVPGQKPLRLSLEHSFRHEMADTMVAELDRFLTRSTVAKFHSQALAPPPSILLQHSAHIECVILTSFYPYWNSKTRPCPEQLGGLVSSGRFHSLRLRKSYLYESDLQALLALYPSGIVLEKSFVFHDEYEGSEGTMLSEEDISAVFPGVTIALELMGDPTADWDILD
ncbi:F-box-like domain protein, putative [Rhizoctonia solani AG-3 Rhs1AP]|uniref:F-box-like domain protein, putative n=1 Tax=Rhizoctonia solani AG-3 Rhs1AP TaxID=1086054 RepID=A0A0A1UIG1_9AGAM|nr:F-box-like domain protein, putative [Rhizoctonia solani AG-3 Rhs1AP]